MSMGDIDVRPATTLADAEQLLILIDRLAEFEKLTPPDDAARQRFVHDGFARVPRRFEALLAGEEDKPPIAYAVFFENYSSFLCRPTLYLEDFFVMPDERSKGIGTLIMKYLGGLAVERECGRMEWTCLDWNVNAQRFYNRIGAQHMSEWFFYRMDRGDLAQYAAKD